MIERSEESKEIGTVEIKSPAIGSEIKVGNRKYTIKAVIVGKDRYLEVI